MVNSIFCYAYFWSFVLVLLLKVPPYWWQIIKIDIIQLEFSYLWWKFCSVAEVMNFQRVMTPKCHDPKVCHRPRFCINRPNDDQKFAFLWQTRNISFAIYKYVCPLAFYELWFILYHARPYFHTYNIGYLFAYIFIGLFCDVNEMHWHNEHQMDTSGRSKVTTVNVC
jgi:hypothetical protein